MRLEYRIRVLQNELRELRGKKGAPAVPEPPETKSAAKKVVKEEVWEDYGAPKEKKKRESKGFSFNFEQNIGARLPVWNRRDCSYFCRVLYGEIFH